MNIAIREENNITTFDLDGRVDSQGAVQLDQALQGALVQGKHNLVLDMLKVDYISSAGLRVLADALSKSKEGGGDVKLVAVNPKVMRVFRIIGFDRFFAVHDSVADAFSAFLRPLGV